MEAWDLRKSLGRKLPSVFLGMELIILAMQHVGRNGMKFLVPQLEPLARIDHIVVHHENYLICLAERNLAPRWRNSFP